MMIVDNAFEIGQTVYLKTDTDQDQRIVTAIQITPSGVTYALSCGPDLSWHYEVEICQEKNIMVNG